MVFSKYRLEIPEGAHLVIVIARFVVELHKHRGRGRSLRDEVAYNSTTTVNNYFIAHLHMLSVAVCDLENRQWL